MKTIRNIALVGAIGAGKTSLVEQMLFNSKTTTRIGKIDDGTTVMDFNPEEIERKSSVSLGIANLMWKKNKINILDAPGLVDFSSEQISASIAVETILFVANGASEFDVSLEKSIELLVDRPVVKGFIINRLDNEGADFSKAIERIRENTDFNPTPILIPIGSEHKFSGIIDIAKGKAFKNGEEIEIPADMTDQVEESKMELMEAVAESNDELLEKYFEVGELTKEEMTTGLKSAISQGKLTPAFATSATHDVGVTDLMDAIVEYLPSPADRNELQIIDNKEEKIIQLNETEDLFAYVFKSFSDPNVGDISYVRVFSGKMTSGSDVYIPEKDSKDRIGSMYYVNGKNRVDADELKAGDIGGLVKMKIARGFDSIVNTNSKRRFRDIKLPTPVYWQAIKAANQHDEDKIGAAMAKLLDEDHTLNLDMNQETAENVISCIGEQQVSLLQKRLKSRYKIEANLKTPAVPYKETIAGTADVHYKHKKQSGGKGQFGEVYFRVKPLARGAGFEFVNSVVGGRIPTKFIPAIEKGLVEVIGKGIISGNQIVDLCVDVYDGGYHDVDSSEMAFKIAAWNALKKAFEIAKPILLEPVHNVQIIIPDEYMGDVMGDISTRRGKIQGMEKKGKKQVLNAEMPLSELMGYYPALKSLTQGRGKFTQEFSHYEKVPGDIAAKVIAEANKED
ncbi:MAG: elongation factor G [Candidatus Cloacimonetes bacterium]|jgi:elongation factor G|nr:elongation factor G [Candidatus Cloacimonadota bacterium]MBT4576572.1 elongation factor G [Candidatus Cloacimonadota bacterium]